MKNNKLIKNILSIILTLAVVLACGDGKGDKKGEGGGVDSSKAILYKLKRVSMTCNSIVEDAFTKYKCVSYSDTHDTIVVYEVTDLNDEKPFKANVTEADGKITAKNNDDEDVEISIISNEGIGDYKDYEPKVKYEDGKITINIKKGTIASSGIFELKIKPKIGTPTIDRFEIYEW